MSCLQASLCVHHCHHLSYAGAHIILTLLKGPNYYQAGQGVGVARGTIITDSPLFFPLDFSVLYSPSTKQSPYCLPLWGYFPYITFLYASLGILPRRQAIHRKPINSHLIVCLSGDTSPTPGRYSHHASTTSEHVASRITVLSSVVAICSARHQR